MTLDDAREEFMQVPTKTNAANYFRTLLSYMMDYMIDDDTFNQELKGLVKVMKSRR